MACDSSVLDHTTVSFDRIGVLPWCFIMWLLWFLLYAIYEKFSHAILMRTLMKKCDAEKLVCTYWNICFSALCVPTTLACLDLSWTEAMAFDVATLESRLAAWWPPTSPPMTLHLRLTFVLLAGFYLNHVAQISIRKGFSHPNFLAAESFLIFFISTYTIRCVLFGMAIVCITNVVQFTLEVSRLFSRFNNTSESKLFQFSNYFFTSVYFSVWCITYMHVVPTWCLMVVGLAHDGLTKFQQDVTHALCLVALCATLWAYYLLEVYQSPVTRYILNKVSGKMVNIRQNHSIVENECKQFEDDLRSYEADLGNEEDPISFHSVAGQIDCSITSHRNLCTCKTSVIEREKIPAKVLNLEVLKGKQATRKNLKVVYQTVKCYMVFKRKIRSMRFKQREKELSLPTIEETGSNDESSSSHSYC